MQDAASDGAQQWPHAAALQLAQVQAQVVQLHDGGHNAIDAHGHGQGDDGHNGDLRGQRLVGHDAQRDGNDLGRQDEVGADGALDAFLLVQRRLSTGRGGRFGRGVIGGVIGVLAMQCGVQQLLGPLETQEQSAQGQQRRHQPGDEGADGQRQRYQDGLVQQRALEHGPDHRQFTVHTHARDLLGVQGQVVAQDACGLGTGGFRECCNIVQQAGDVVD